MNIKEQREEQVARHLPDLFTGYKSVLYVGANQRRQHFVDMFAKTYDKIVILEAFDKNCEFLKKKFTDDIFEIIHGDVRNAGKIFEGRRFDVVFFWHGISCLYEKEIASTLSMLEEMCKLVVLGLPHGYYEQRPTYGNVFDQHHSAIYPPFLKELGYVTDVMGGPDVRGSNILAWKFVGEY